MRRAMSPLIATMLLVAISVSLTGIVYSGILAQTYESMNCEIQVLEIHEISENSYWGTLQAINDGDYDIESYELVLYGGVITPDTMTSGTISPGKHIKIEFLIANFIENEAMIVLNISNQEHVSHCLKGVEL